MRSPITLVLSLVLSLALASPALAQPVANRFVTVDNIHWGYVRAQGAAVPFPDMIDNSAVGAGFRAGLFITILTRDGQPVTGADIDAARRAAAEACAVTRRQFDMGAHGTLLRRGGILFREACG